MGEWTFFSNHGHVLVCLARDREARLRDVALQVGITERAVQKIVRDMQDAGYLEVSKHGRRNRYRINNRKALRHQLQSGCTVGQLLKLLGKKQLLSQNDAPVTQPQTQVDVVPPTVAQPEVVEPEAVQPEVMQPEVVEPKVMQPEVVEPQAVLPQADQPQADQPQADQPQADQPQADQPQADQPEPIEVESAESRTVETVSKEKSEKKPKKADLEQGQLF